MTQSDSIKDLELEPELDVQPEASSGGAGAEGSWVWQYAAPPPPPSFLAVFFSGTALKELYRFFACGLLVVLGSLLPWGPTLSATDGADAVALVPPPHAGVETPAGALALVIGLWLVFSSCYGIYSRRQKILPVFLMLEPAIASWGRLLDAWAAVDAEQPFAKVGQLLDLAGSGVLLTLVGSTWVSLGFLFLVGKVYAKKDDKSAARRAPARGARSDASAGKAGGDVGSPATGSVTAGTDPAAGSAAAASRDAAGSPAASGSHDELPVLEELPDLQAEPVPTVASSEAGGASVSAADPAAGAAGGRPSGGSAGDKDGAEARGGSRGRRGRRR